MTPDFNFLFAPQQFRPELHGAMPQYTPPGGMGGGPAVAPTNVNMQPVAAPPAGVLAQTAAPVQAQPQAAQAAPQAQERRYLMNGGLGDYLRSNQGSMFNLAAGLLGGREGLQQALANMPAAMQGDRAAADRQKQNAAIQKWIGSQGMSPEGAALAQAYPEASAAAALQRMFAEPKERRIMKDAAGRQRYVDTSEYVFPDVQGGGATFLKPDEQFKMERDLRKDFDALTKDFREVNDAYARVQTSAEADSPAGDLSMIFNYMKMLDPGSVVRESEFATAASARPLLERLGISWDAVSTVWEGKRLTPAQRADFVRMSQGLYDAQRGDFEIRRDEYQGIAGQYGLSPERVVSERDYKVQPFGAPKVGDVEGGYRYLGGDPADPNSWQAVGQ